MTGRRRSESVLMNKWKWVLAAVACSGLACTSASAVRKAPAPQSLAAASDCSVGNQQLRMGAVYQVSCRGFEPENLYINAGGVISFRSTCDSNVVISFSDPDNLFESGTKIIELGPLSSSPPEQVKSNAGCHQVCFGSASCPSEERDSKTGSLDVHTSVPEPKP